MKSSFNPFVIKPNKFLVLQVNDFCLPFMPYNPYIYIHILSIFDVGLVSEKKKILQALSWNLQV